jgi:hypothetical protein
MTGFPTFDLLFLWDKEDRMANRDAIAHVCLGHHSSGANYKGHEDAILLTQQCMTLSEFDHHIARLKRELDDVTKKARKKFAELEEFRKAGSTN